MRNLSMKSKHIRPITQNSFKKTERKYPDHSEKLHTKKYERNENELNKKEQAVNQQIVFPKTVQIIPNNMSSFKYHFAVLNPFPIHDRNSNTMINDQNCAWFKNFEKPPNANKVCVEFNKMKYLISDWAGDGFPHTINVCMDGMFGYLDIHNQPTERVSILSVKNIDEEETEVGKIYEVIYESNEKSCWEIPKGLTSIRFYLTLDDEKEAIELPLPNQLDIEFEIRFE